MRVIVLLLRVLRWTKNIALIFGRSPAVTSLKLTQCRYLMHAKFIGSLYVLEHVFYRLAQALLVRRCTRICSTTLRASAKYKSRCIELSRAENRESMYLALGVSCVLRVRQLHSRNYSVEHVFRAYLYVSRVKISAMFGRRLSRVVFLVR